MRTTFVLGIFLALLVGSYAGKKASYRKRLEAKCEPCDLRFCPVMDVELCTGSVIKDDCGCCPVCKLDASVFMVNREENNVTALMLPISNLTDSACSQIQCPKRQLCLLNIQGIPVCRCPNLLWCRKRSARPLCVEGNKTYRNRCHLQVAQCESSDKIRIVSKGACPGQTPSDTVLAVGKGNKLSKSDKLDRRRKRLERRRQRRKQPQNKNVQAKRQRKRQRKWKRRN